MGVLVNMKIYKQNKKISQNLRKIDELFLREFPQKSWAWVGVTSLLYSQIALENYLKETKPEQQFISMIKRVVWQYINILNKCSEIRKD